MICLDGRDLSETFQGRLSLPEVLRRKVRSAGEHGVTLAPSETKALMTGHRIGTCQIGQANRRNSAQRGEAYPRRPKFIGPIARRYGPPQKL